MASEPAGIKLPVPDDFIILDKSKATDGSADAYWDEMAQRTGTEAKALKVLMARRNAVAIDSTGTMIEISKRKEPSMPSLDAVAKDARGLPDVEVTEVDTALGKGIRVSLTLIAGKKYQQFLYAQGSTSVVGVSVVSKTAARAASVFDQVVPTIRAV